MTEYKACKCGKCKRYYMSTAKKPKCTYCSSTISETKYTNTKPAIISEAIRQGNIEHLTRKNFI